MLVRKVLDEKTLNLIYMRKCTACTRRYMLAYYHSLAKNATTPAGNPDEKVGFDPIAGEEAQITL